MIYPFTLSGENLIYVKPGLLAGKNRENGAESRSQTLEIPNIAALASELRLRPFSNCDC